MTTEDRLQTGPSIDYPAALLEQNRLLGELIRASDPTTPVPSCPGWTLQQLMRHVGRGDRWAAQMISDRATTGLDPRQVRDGKPPDDLGGAIEWLHGSARAVPDAVNRTGTDIPIWTFLGPRPSAWWIRRRLHESTVHRADAALALGIGYRLDAALAADGVSEWLDLFAGMSARSSQQPLADGVRLHLHGTDPEPDTGGEWTVEGIGNSVSWSTGHTDGAAVALRGPSVGLLLALTRRQAPDEAGVELLGDTAIWTNWLASTPF